MSIQDFIANAHKRVEAATALWMIREQFTNRAVLREDGEKWPDDVNGEPSAEWTPIIQGLPSTDLKLALQMLEIAIEEIKNMADQTLYEEYGEEEWDYVCASIAYEFSIRESRKVLTRMAELAKELK